MSKEQIRQQLERLHLELLRLGDLDPQAQDKVDAAASHIQALLEDPNADNYPSTLADVLNDSVTALEVSHPRITELINRITELLASIGI